MLLGGHPDVAVAPFAEVAQLLHLGMQVLHVVFHWQTRRVENAHVAAESEEDPRCFESEQAGVGSAACLSIECGEDNPARNRPRGEQSLTVRASFRIAPGP